MTKATRLSDLGGGIDCTKVVRSGADSAHGTALGPEGERMGDLERGNLRQGLCEVGAGAIEGVVGQVRDCMRFQHGSVGVRVCARDDFRGSRRAVSTAAAALATAPSPRARLGAR